VSGADMSDRSCLHLPRGAWQQPASREPVVVTTHASTHEAARGSRSIETSRLASAEDDEAEAPNGPKAYRAMRAQVPVRLLALFGGGGR